MLLLLPNAKWHMRSNRSLASIPPIDQWIRNTFICCSRKSLRDCDQDDFLLFRYSRGSESVLEMRDIFGWKPVWVNPKSLSLLKGEASVFVLRHAALSKRQPFTRHFRLFHSSFTYFYNRRFSSFRRTEGDNSFPPPSRPSVRFCCRP